MINEKSLTMGSEYTFDVFGSIDGQQTFTGTAIGIYDARYAAVQDSEELEVNIINNYANLDAETKELLNNDPDFRAFPVLKLIDAQKVEFSIAFPWINESTFNKNTSGQATVLVDGITSANIADLRVALVANGFDVVKISLAG